MTITDKEKSQVLNHLINDWDFPRRTELDIKKVLRAIRKDVVELKKIKYKKFCEELVEALKDYD